MNNLEMISGYPLNNN